VKIGNGFRATNIYAVIVEMKIDELITELEKVKQEHGNLGVFGNEKRDMMAKEKFFEDGIYLNFYENPLD